MKTIRISRENHFLYLIFLAALLPMLLLRDFTPANELRYLSIADEALRNHTFFTFTNHGEPCADETPLYLWIVMLCRWVTGGHHLWLISMFSLLPACAIVRMMDQWTRHEIDGEGRMLARMMTLTCGLFYGATLTLRMDMLMTLFIVLALREFWKKWNGEDTSGRAGWLFPVYVFLAVFTKGPMGLLIPLVATAVFLVASDHLKRFFHFWDLRTWGMLALCFAVWFGAVYAEAGASYLKDMLVHENLGRAVNSFHHARPYYYYAVCIWYCLAPWSLLAIGVTVAALRRSFVRSDLQRFFLSVAVSTLVLLSCFSSKLQVYMLPAIPFLIYITAMSLPRFRNDKWLRVALAVPAFLFALTLPAMYVATSRHWADFLDEGMLYAAATILSIMGVHALWPLLNKQCEEAVSTCIRWMGTGVLLALFVAGWAWPRLNVMAGYGAVCDKALELSQKHGITEFYAWHLVRPRGMDIYLHRPVKEVQREDVPSPSGGKPYLLLTRKRDLVHFPGMEKHIVGRYAVVVCP